MNEQMGIISQIVPCPHCTRAAFGLFRVVQHLLATPGQDQQAVPELVQVECPWCRTIYIPLDSDHTRWGTATTPPSNPPTYRERMELAALRPRRRVDNSKAAGE